MSDQAIVTLVEYDQATDAAEAPKPLPKRDYRAVIRAAEVKTGQKNNMYFDVTFYISADQYPVDYTDGNPEGTEIHYRRISAEQNPGARWRCRGFIDAIGAKHGKQIDTNEWIGLEANVTIDHRPFDGLMQNEITKVSKL